ncbi:DNA repair protein RadA [Balneolales bacterium ANBcel1]|nr:DNA repair protein RadA [Balneolales bacterium ANBcel1]
MAKKNRTRFVCTNCGWESSRWMGNCDSCSQWNTMEEVPDRDPVADKPHKARLARPDDAPARPLALSEIPASEASRHQTGIGELDRVLGGGVIPGSFILLGGDPGIGKSTLALQCSVMLDDQKTLYVSGEESLAQIRQRSGRLGLHSDSLLIYTETEIMRVIETARSEKPGILVIDSIQTVYHSGLQSMPGTTAQIRECAALLMQFAKQENTTVIAIGHVTKEGDLAGPRILEHMVDTVLQFEGDKQSHHRILRTLKNRFGPAHEVGIFEMNDDGLREVANPSELFLSELDPAVSGNAVVCSMEGTRPLLIEVQALVAPASYAMPQRTASGFDQRRLSLLLAVLEKRCGMAFHQHDVFLNVAGGMKLSETACDLGVACALVSSISGKATGEPIVIIGEVGLGAEVRRVTRLTRRLEEAGNMGFSRAVVPAGSNHTREKRVRTSPVKNVEQALRECGLD